MNVVPSLTICEIQDGVYSKQRERQTQKERAQDQGGCAAAGAEVATLRWGLREGLWAAGEGALGTPGSVQTRLKVLFSLLLAKALLIKPLDFFYLVEM